MEPFPPRDHGNLPEAGGGEDDNGEDNSKSDDIESEDEGDEPCNQNSKQRASDEYDSDDEDKKLPAAATLAAMSGKGGCRKLGSTAADCSTTGNKRKRKAGGIASNERWEEMFKRLKKFKERHNHCSVPNRYPEDPSLGCWVSTQRRHYKKAQQKPGEGLTPERAARLIQMGFEWTGENPRHRNWDLRFEELKEFKAKYGHAQVPIGFEDNVQLANWTSTQRQEYKNILKGKSSRLNDQRIKQLESIGFVWELQRGGRRRRVTVTQGATTRRIDNSNPGSGNAQGNRAVQDSGSASSVASEAPARSTSLVLPGVALLGGDQKQYRAASSAVESFNKSGEQQHGRARHRLDGGNSNAVQRAQPKHPPRGPSPKALRNEQKPSSATEGTESRSNVVLNQTGFEGSTSQQQNPAHTFGASLANTTNPFQALVGTPLLSGGSNQNTLLSSLITYQQALAILANQPGGSGLSLDALPVSTCPAGLGPPLAAQFHSLITQQSSQNDRLRLELGMVARQPNLGSGLTNSLLLQAVSVLLQPPSGAAMLPEIQSQGSQESSSLASGRMESKTDDINISGPRHPASEGGNPP